MSNFKSYVKGVRIKSFNYWLYYVWSYINLKVINIEIEIYERYLLYGLN